MIASRQQAQARRWRLNRPQLSQFKSKASPAWEGLFLFADILKYRAQKKGQPEKSGWPFFKSYCVGA